MPVGRDLKEYSDDEIKTWLKKKGLEPGIVRNTKEGIQFVEKGGNEKVAPTDWDTFFRIMKKKKLAVYGTKEGWMKIMRRK